MTVNLTKIAENVTAKLEQVGYDDLSMHEKVFLCVWLLESETSQGGFDNYFCSAAGCLATDAVGALQAIGAEALASLLQEAIALFGEAGVPSSRKERRMAVGAFDDAAKQKLQELDAAYAACEEDIARLLERFVA